MQSFRRPRAKRTPEPRLEGKGEAHLCAPSNGPWHLRRGIRQEWLIPIRRKMHFSWERQRSFDQAMVEQRLADLQAVCHSHHVGVTKQRIAKVVGKLKKPVRHCRIAVETLGPRCNLPIEIRRF
jgi:hypothetical protein